MLSAYELWTWERCRESILSLKGRLGYEERLWILGFELRDDGRLIDPYRGVEVFDPSQAGSATGIPARYSAVPEMYCILCKYAAARERPLNGEWVSFASFYPVRRQELPAMDCAELLHYAGEGMEILEKADEPFFGGRTAGGDLAFTVWPLPRVPLNLVLWRGDEEMASGGSVRFDRSAPAYVGDLLGELVWLTVWRLRNILHPEVKWGYHGLASTSRGSERDA